MSREVVAGDQQVADCDEAIVESRRAAIADSVAVIRALRLSNIYRVGRSVHIEVHRGGADTEGTEDAVRRYDYYFALATYGWWGTIIETDFGRDDALKVRIDWGVTNTLKVWLKPEEVEFVDRE